ncbi:MAG: TerB family tellurite resistance protein [Phycisphaerales bacterium]|nr:TerB family tellurite resistance protein [Phycisphaerales bacterium]
MIIWGTRSVNRTINRGDFHCPQCKDRRPYRERRSRTFLHVYWIPMFPLSGRSEHVWCERCKSMFQREVLMLDPRAQQAAAQTAFTKAMITASAAMAAADGNVLDAEVERAWGYVDALGGGADITVDKIRAFAGLIAAGRADPAAELEAVADMIPPHAKELIIQIACTIAAADGEADPAEGQMLRLIGASLDMSEAHVFGVMASMRQG